MTPLQNSTIVHLLLFIIPQQYNGPCESLNGIAHTKYYLSKKMHLNLKYIPSILLLNLHYFSIQHELLSNNIAKKHSIVSFTHTHTCKLLSHSKALFYSLFICRQKLFMPFFWANKILSYCADYC